MESFWTSKKPIKGLRHFVLVNKTKEKGQKVFLMVSVLGVREFVVDKEKLVLALNLLQVHQTSHLIQPSLLLAPLELFLESPSPPSLILPPVQYLQL